MLAIINCSQLLTLRGPERPRVGAEMLDLGIVENGVVLIEDETIVNAGPASSIPIPRDCRIEDAKGRLVMPGFVDAHTHPVFAGYRTEEFDPKSNGATSKDTSGRAGMRATVRRTRAATEEQLYDAARRHAAWFLRCGTTTIEAKSGYGLTLNDELKLLRVIRRLAAEGVLRTVPTFLGANDIPDEYRGRPREYLDLVTRDMLPRVAERKAAEFCDVYCEPGTFGIMESRLILQAARALGLRIRMHVDQFSESDGAALAAEMNAVTADHLECTDTTGLISLREASVQPVLLPGSVFSNRTGVYPDGRAMIETGLPIVLASDFNAGSPIPSMPLILSLAVAQMRITPAEAITASTINAAYSLRRGDWIGSLTPGKLADIVIHDCRDYRELVYYCGIEHASKVYLGGKLVFART